MKPLFFLLLALTMLSETSPAGDEVGIRPEEGVLTLDFSLDGWFQLREGSGGTISLRRWMDRKSALSLGLTLGWATQESDRYTMYVYEDTTLTEDVQEEQDMASFEIEVLYQRIVRGENPVLLLGVGPIAGLREYDSNDLRPPTFATRQDSETTIRYAGLQLAAGAEWYFGPAFSLSAWYLPRIVYERQEYSSSRIVDGVLNYQQKHDSTEWALYSSEVRLGLSIWFD